MGAIRPPKRAKLFTGLLAGDADLFALAERRLTDHFGPIDLRSSVWPFDATEYYEPELGDDVKRTFVAFAELVSIERLAEIKRQTNVIERRLCDELAREPGVRPVNVDPGYVTPSKVILATTKDHAHRIYLQHGIYAEITLRYESGAWRPWPWTYPDYAGAAYHDFFVQARNRLKEQLSAESP